MIIRRYSSSDCAQMAELFYWTVHSVNAKDYTKEQLNVWATGQVDLARWDKSFSEHYTVVAIWEDVLAGFGDIDRTGYLDRLYVHKDYQRRGIATAICDSLERAFPVEKVTSHVSVTARPFFQSRGYLVQREQQVVRGGILLTNYVMEKRLSRNV